LTPGRESGTDRNSSTTSHLCEYFADDVVRMMPCN
jgi:hypothetical protein